MTQNMDKKWIQSIKIPIEQLITDFQIQNLLKSQNITYLNAIQSETIQKGLFFHKSFLVCTPSGSGKTLIGELAIANILFRNLGRAIYLVPYKALANEKSRSFSKIFTPFHLTVKAITGDSDIEDQNLERVDCLITTYEKFDSLMRQNNQFLKQVRVVIIDEIHELGEESRGARLELLLMRLFDQKYYLQIIALSATIKNINIFQNWLSSFGHRIDLIHNTKRPIELKFTFEITKNKIKVMRYHINRVLEEKGQVLVFVNRRKDCINLAKLLQTLTSQFLTDDEERKCQNAKKKLRANNSLATGLGEFITKGIAYHNAALGSEERTLVEDLYKSKILKVLIATTTLAAGVNTPARTVIVSDIIQHRKMINLKEKDYSNKHYVLGFGRQGLIRPHSPNLLFQMLGRAGRVGFDEEGEGIILLNNENELNFAREYYFERIENNEGKLIPKYSNLESQLNSKRELQEMILLLITEHPNISKEQILKFLEKSFFAYCLNNKIAKNPLNSTELNQSIKTSHLMKLQSQLLQYLFIDRMDIAYFLQCYGDFSYRNEKNHNWSWRLDDLTHGQIFGRVFINSEIKNCIFDINKGLSCSCSNNAWFQYKTANDNGFSRKICTHLTYLIGAIASKPDTLEYQILNLILPIIVNHEYVLEYLLCNKVISQSHTKTYSITNFGKLAFNLYIYPDQLIWVRQNLEKFAFHNEKFTISKFVEFTRENNLKNRESIADVISYWINEHTMEDILRDYPQFGVGDLFNLKNEMSRTAMIFQNIALFLGKQEIADKFQEISLRIKHGVKKELLNLMETLQPNITRNKARLLMDAGFFTAYDFLSVAPLEAANRSQMSLVQIMGIRGRSKPVNQQISLMKFIN